MKSLILSGGFAVCMLVGLALALSWRSQDQVRLEQARKANCTAIEHLKAIQRDALSEDIVASRTFLRQNPEGIPGIPPELIEEGITRDQNQLRNLAPMEC